MKINYQHVKKIYGLKNQLYFYKCHFSINHYWPIFTNEKYQKELVTKPRNFSKCQFKTIEA